MTILPILVLAANTLSAGWTQIPQTQSPDGRLALYEQKKTGLPGDSPFAVYFRNKHDLAVSPQLVPDLTGKVVGQSGDWKTADDWDTQMLLNAMAGRQDALRTGDYDRGFSYFVRWSPDGSWVSVEGGAHKFWHMMVYHLTGQSFAQVDLSRESKLIDEFFNSRAPDFQVTKIGIDKAVRGNAAADWSSVGWVQNGEFVVNGYPFLLRDSHFGSVREKNGEIYFLIDCRNLDQPKVIDLCQ